MQHYLAATKVGLLCCFFSVFWFSVVACEYLEARGKTGSPSAQTVPQYGGLKALVSQAFLLCADLRASVYTYAHIYIYTPIQTDIDVYRDKERESQRETERERERQTERGLENCSTNNHCGPYGGALLTAMSELWSLLFKISGTVRLRAWSVGMCSRPCKCHQIGGSQIYAPKMRLYMRMKV